MCDKHPEFDINAGDRAKKKFSEAMNLATKRATTRGRQRVVQHRGHIFKRGVWFIQDIREGTQCLNA